MLNKQEPIMDIKQVNSTIMFGTWTDVELQSMIEAIQFARASLRKRVKASLFVGNRVRWVSSKNPSGASGTVKKIAVKFVTVCKDNDGTLWKIPANMLEPI
jgi:hypothetical protein